MITSAIDTVSDITKKQQITIGNHIDSSAI